MKHILNGGELTLFPTGRIDTAASVAFKSETTEACASMPHTSLVLDAADLTFISSSGLRVILSLAKTEKNMKLINVNQDVYSVFEMTGFTKMLNIEKALRKINLEACEKIGFGGTGAVYRISEDEIVKVNYNRFADDEIEMEVKKAKEAFILGVPTAISFDIVDCGNGNKGVIYETIKSKTLGEMMQSDNALIDELMPKYVELLNTLHAIHTDNPMFGSAKEYYRQLLTDSSKYIEPEEKAMLQQIWETLPDGDTLVHCDAHPKNVMVQNGELMWIDMSVMSVGHPLYDLISISVIFNVRDSKATLGMFGMDVPTMNKVQTAFIRNYFHTDDPEEIARLMKMMIMLRFIRTVFSLGVNTPTMDVYRPTILEMARQNFFPNLQNILNIIKYLSERC